VCVSGVRNYFPASYTCIIDVMYMYVCMYICVPFSLENQDLSVVLSRAYYIVNVRLKKRRLQLE